jgi:hypothetical protein
MYPLVSCLVPTSPQRRVFWPKVFEDFAKQTYPNKELFLLDEESYERPLPEGIKHILLDSSKTIGAKLNLGVELSKANYFHKWDDDDRYSPSFLEKSITPLFRSSGIVSFVDHHLLFNLNEWTLYDLPYTIGGGTICFDRQAWDERPFPNLSFGEDQDFYLNRRKALRITPIPNNYVLVRHGQNTWKTWENGKTVEQVAKDRGNLIPGGPESFFSKEDLEFYQKFR